MKKILFIASVILWMPACHRSALKVTCPEPQNVTIPQQSVNAASLNLPEPDFTNDCDDSYVSVEISAGNTIVPGENQITYTLKNYCDDEADCKMKVVATLEYRNQFTGTYSGYINCGAWNMTQQHSDGQITCSVKIGDKPNTLLVDGDEVTIDSSGNFIHPSLGNYRRYNLGFSNDSIFRFQEWGNTNTFEQCNFAGKKQ